MLLFLRLYLFFVILAAG